MRSTQVKTKKELLSKVELKELYERTKHEMALLSEITNAMMQSLELDQVLYTILTALTSHEGLGFDRAMFFLVNDDAETLDGKMGIGPHSADEADKLWQRIDSHKLSLRNLIDSYYKFKTDPESKLNSVVKGISIPIREDAGILALTILEGMPFEVTNDEAKAMVNAEVRSLLNMDLFVTIPLKTRAHTQGAIVVDNISSGTMITKDNIRILNMFADHAALAVENSRLYGKTVHLSQTDWLTGLWNARHFNFVLDEKIKMAAKDESALSLLLVDIDNFKEYNDTLGHQRGDEAIRRVSTALKGSSRNTDFVCRYGGEEFAIVMAGINRNNAQMIAERLRQEVEESFKNDTSVPDSVKLTVSLGLSVFPYDSEGKEDLIRKADLALYQAKQTGKNRTCTYVPELG